MPSKSKDYSWVRFSPEAIEQARVVFASAADAHKGHVAYFHYEVERGSETWTHDTIAEFYGEYRLGFSNASLTESVRDQEGHNIGTFFLTCRCPDIEMQRIGVPVDTTVKVALSTRDEIQRVFEALESTVDKSKVVKPRSRIRIKATIPGGKVFIGHGQDPQWKVLKDHLHDTHGYDVVCYEVGSRTGYVVKETLEQMVSTSAVALLVFTGEDQDRLGGMHARENVIHELGLFQGALGWTKAAVLLEEGVAEFSNIVGTEQIRFPRTRIAEKHGDVIAFLEREGVRKQSATRPNRA